MRTAHDRTRTLAPVWRKNPAAAWVQECMDTPRRFRCTAQCGFAARFKTENGLAKKHNWPRHCAVFGRHRERVPRFPLSPHTRDSIVPRSDFVEAIQHFVARPKYYHTQREDQKGSHFSIPPSSRSKLRGGFSVDEFSVELTDTVVPVLVLPEFWFCDAAGSVLFQGLRFAIQPSRLVEHERVFWSQGIASWTLQKSSRGSASVHTYYPLGRVKHLGSTCAPPRYVNQSRASKKPGAPAS